jgi:hypothetical protein
MVLMYAAVLFALCGAAVWARVRERALHPILAGTILIAAAVATATDLAYAIGWYLLGDLGDKHTISPATIQGLHAFVAAADMPGVAGLGTFFVAFAAAGILGRLFRRWLTWPALALGILRLVPTPGTAGFVASLLSRLDRNQRRDALIWVAMGHPGPPRARTTPCCGTEAAQAVDRPRRVSLCRVRKQRVAFPPDRGEITIFRCQS